MKVAILCHPTQGGSGIVATELALGLTRKNHEVHLISCDRPFRLKEDAPVLYHRVTVSDYPLFRYPPHDLSLVNKIVEVCCDYDIDIIHAHYAVPHAICAILANHVIQPHHVKIVATLHGTDITLVGSHPDFKRVCQYTMTMADGLTVVSNWLRDRTIEEFEIKRTPDVIYNFVDTFKFNPDGRLQYPAEGDPFRIVHVSNFRPVKRTTDVIRVFNSIQSRVPALLTLAGEGPDLGVARELCAELNICDKVIFAGVRFDIEKILRQNHLLLLLSDYESFGLSSLEAMACGTPVAVSRSGGLPEVVEEAVTGLLFPVGAIQEIATGCVELLVNRQRWEEMSRQASRIAIECFSADKVISQYESFYKKIIESSHATEGTAEQRRNKS